MSDGRCLAGLPPRRLRRLTNLSIYKRSDNPSLRRILKLGGKLKYLRISGYIATDGKKHCNLLLPDSVQNFRAKDCSLNFKDFPLLLQNRGGLPEFKLCFYTFIDFISNGIQVDQNLRRIEHTIVDCCSFTFSRLIFEPLPISDGLSKLSVVKLTLLDLDCTAIEQVLDCLLTHCQISRLNLENPACLYPFEPWLDIKQFLEYADIIGLDTVVREVRDGQQQWYLNELLDNLDHLFAVILRYSSDQALVITLVSRFHSRYRITLLKSWKQSRTDANIRFTLWDTEVKNRIGPSFQGNAVKRQHYKEQSHFFSHYLTEPDWKAFGIFFPHLYRIFKLRIRETRARMVETTAIFLKSTAMPLKTPAMKRAMTLKVRKVREMTLMLVKSRKVRKEMAIVFQTFNPFLRS